jgi:UDP-GlcNAc:undecaprenyl-phosphate GlcNAc-1-phosphate transferase
MLLALTFIVAIAASLLCTRLFRALARKLGFVDLPDGERKVQKEAVALGGGAAVLVATIIALVFGFATSSAFESYDWASYVDSTFFRSLVLASLVIVAVGLLDDLTNMRGHFKLAGQVVAVCILIFYGGLQIDKFKLLGETFEFGWYWVAVGFTMFWMLGAINAINLIDGIDGLASSVGFVLCLAIAAVMAYQGNYTATMIMLALAGALLGFLKYNFAPASIYLGDAGSMFIGLIVGAVAIYYHGKSAATMALAVPVAVWSIPMLDSVAAILRRRLTGKSVFAADRQHLHHSLLVRGWTVRQAVLFIGLICATTCVAALVCVYVGTVWSELLALGTVVGVTVFLISTKTFGHIEFGLLRERVQFTTRALASRESDHENTFHERRIRLQGSDDWERLWVGLTESAERYSLVSVRLNIDIPSMHQCFVGTWQLNQDQRSGNGGRDSVWTVETPLAIDGRSVGHLTISGRPDGKPTLAHISQVLDFVDPIEDDVRQILGKLAQADEQGAIPDPSLPAPVPSAPRRTVIANPRPVAVENEPSKAIATSGQSG